MKAYIYRADLFCEACGKAIRERLTAQGKAPANPDDEYTYDSDNFPKGPLDNGGGASDSVYHCGNGDKCLEPTEINGEKYGKLLEHPLTTEGVRILNENIEENGDNPVVRFHAEHYAPLYRDINWPPKGSADSEGGELD
jgi:hypothetical protein